MLHVVDNAVYIASHAPEEFLNHSTSAQVDEAQREAIKSLFAYLESIVPVLDQASLVYLVPNLIQVTHEFVVLGGYDVNILVPLWQSCSF